MKRRRIKTCYITNNIYYYYSFTKKCRLVDIEAVLWISYCNQKSSEEFVCLLPRKEALLERSSSNCLTDNQLKGVRRVLFNNKCWISKRLKVQQFKNQNSQITYFCFIIGLKIKSNYDLHLSWIFCLTVLTLKRSRDKARSIRPQNTGSVVQNICSCLQIPQICKVVFSVNLVCKEELNLMLKVSDI